MQDDARFVNSINRILYLRTLPFFGDLSPSDLAVLGEYARERRFNKGEVLLEEGRPVSAIHLVVEGGVEVRRAGKPFRRFGPKDAVGVMGMLARSDEGVEAQAAEPTVTLELSADALFDVFEDHFTILRHALSRVTGLLIDERRQIPGDAGFGGNVVESVVCPARPLDLVERIFLLRRAFPFSQGSVDALAGLARHVVELRLAPGRALWRPGDESESLLLLVCGAVRCETPEGQRFRFGPGAGVGALDAMAGRPRWYRAVTEEGVVALQVTVEDLMDVFEDHFTLAMSALARLSSEVLEVFERRASDEPGRGPAHPFGLPPRMAGAKS